MSNSQTDILFQLHKTADGSPTLSLDGGEKMHSLDGALSESLYVYGSCLEQALDEARLAQPRILSMGLGLGYNEWIALALLKINNIDTFDLVSYEKIPFLVSSLENWLQNNNNPLTDCYKTIVASIAEHFKLNFEELLEFAKKNLQSQHWRLMSELSIENLLDFRFNVLFYDAFSSETDKSLWSQEHLENFIDQYCQTSPCYLTTYAATGTLNRALKQKGFSVTKKPGFGKKRESTFALRL